LLFARTKIIYHKVGASSNIVTEVKNIELSKDEVVADPGLQKLICEFAPDIRDGAKRAY
jgi:hypothetical protein